jgi:hypothetical protein
MTVQQTVHMQQRNEGILRAALICAGIVKRELSLFVRELWAEFNACHSCGTNCTNSALKTNLRREATHIKCSSFAKVIQGIL